MSVLAGGYAEEIIYLFGTVFGVLSITTAAAAAAVAFLVMLNYLAVQLTTHNIDWHCAALSSRLIDASRSRYVCLCRYQVESTGALEGKQNQSAATVPRS